MKTKNALILTAVGLAVSLTGAALTFLLPQNLRAVNSALAGGGIGAFYVAVARNVVSTIKYHREAVEEQIRNQTEEEIRRDLRLLAVEIDRYEDLARTYARRLIGSVAVSAAVAALSVQALHRGSPTETLAGVYLALIAFVFSGIASLTTNGRLRPSPPVREIIDRTSRLPEPELRRQHTRSRKGRRRAWLLAVGFGFASVVVFLLLAGSLVLLALGQHLSSPLR